MSTPVATCAGCGKELTPGKSGTGASYHLAPGVEVRVCANKNSNFVRAVRSCLAAAREKLRPCLGCGQGMGQNWRADDALCRDCAGVLDRVRAVGERQPVKWVGIAVGHLLGDYVGQYEGTAARDVLDRLASALGLALGRSQFGAPKNEYVGSALNTGDRLVSTDLYVQIEESRVEHLRDFLRALAEVGQAARDLGREEGHSALLRLARGETTVDDYESRRKKR